MKKIVLAFLSVCVVLNMDARIPSRSANDNVRSSDPATMIADAKLPLTLGDNDVFLPGSEATWRNGTDNCEVVDCVNKRDEVDHLAFMLDVTGDWENNKHYYEVKLVKGSPRVVNQSGVTVKHQVAGQWDLLVFRNSKNAVIDVAIRNKSAQGNNTDDEKMNDLRDLFNGVWVGAQGDTAVMGTIMGREKRTLPGRDYVMQYMPRDYNNANDRQLALFYVNERMKRVHFPEPSKRIDEDGVVHYYADGVEIGRNEYESLLSRPNGYGGHASLHGPLIWWVKLVGDDLAVELNEHYDPSTDYESPFKEDKFTLRWVCSAFEGMNDRWAIVSMRPLTRGLLSHCGEDVLRQMLNYLGKRKTLTDIEQLNQSLITTMLN